MTLQNRVTPEGEIVADPARGTLMGNRGGPLHRDDGTLGTARWRSARWIACRLEFKGRRRKVMGPGYTELFFLDEATAYAAGHRPCAECRRAAFRAFQAAWADAFGPARADAIDAALQRSRTDRPRRKVSWTAPARDLPDGTMIRTEDGPALVLGDACLRWRMTGYGPRGPRPGGPAEVLTPRPIVTLLRAGLPVACHPSAAGQA